MSQNGPIGEDIAAKLKLWSGGIPAADAALAPLRNLAALPFVYRHVAAMPGLRADRGAASGIAVATTDAIVPAAVGSDIGCGMMALRTGLTARDLPDDLSALGAAIAAAVPHGGRDDADHDRADNDRADGEPGAWDEPPEANLAVLAPLEARLAALIAKHPALAGAALNAAVDLGTLGAGGAFVALCRDEEERLWIILRAGSRRIGHAIARAFIDRAKEHMARWHIVLPDAGLAYLPEGIDDFDDYVEAAAWAQDFALANRQLIMAATLGTIEDALGASLSGDVAAVNCLCNTIAREHHFGRDVWVARNGAMRAGSGEFAVVAGAAGAPSFVVCGKGNADSFQSCASAVGEPAGAAMAAQSDLVEIVRTLRPLLRIGG